MQVDSVKKQSDAREYLRFAMSLYTGDEGFVCTQKFNAEALLYRQTDFARSCFIQPLVVRSGGKIIAALTLIRPPDTPFLQIGLFEAEEGTEAAVALLIDEARSQARAMGLDKIVVGMNGHLSYGVGILEDNFNGKMTFDSLYNKPYYSKLLMPHVSAREGLCTYRAAVDEVKERLAAIKPHEGITVMPACLRRFNEQTERLRQLSNKTLIRTNLYFKAEPNHFTQQMSGLRLLLCNDNLLFAQDESKTDCGFLFWHADYNSMLCGGRDYNLLSLFLRARRANKRSDTLKINAIGTTSDNVHIAASLIYELVKRVGSNFKHAETTFVWESNRPSRLLTQRLFGQPYRRYGVYTIEV